MEQIDRRRHSQHHTENQAIENTPCKAGKSKEWYVWLAVLSVLFFITSSFCWEMLTNIWPTFGYILLLSSNCFIFGWWVWELVGWLHWKYPFIKFKVPIRIISLLSVVLMLVFSSPFYIGYSIKPLGKIEMQTFLDSSIPIFIHYGTRADDDFYIDTTIEELEQEGGYASITIDGQNLFSLRVENNKLYIDTLLFAGFLSQNQHISVRHVVIQNNIFSWAPEGWKIYQNNMNLEIVNEDGIPVLIMQYKRPDSITISGLFGTIFGICKVDNDPNSIFKFGETLEELGIYKVDRVFVHSIFDLFRSERTYILK